MSKSHLTNTLLEDRSHLTARKSIEALISFTRDQDEKMYSLRRVQRNAGFIMRVLFLVLPGLWAAKQIVSGYWPQIHPRGLFALLVPGFEFRPKYAPEIFLAEKELRKLELEFKTSEELLAIFPDTNV